MATCQLCQKHFSTGRSLSTHVYKYHRSGSNSIPEKNYHNLLNNPKFLKMVCKGLLDGSMPLGKNLTFQLKPYGDKVREIAGSRVPKINQILKNYQDTSQSYYTLLELIENAYKENVEIFN